MAQDPMFFVLMNNGHKIEPWEKLEKYEKTVLIMEEAEEPLFLEEEGEFSMNGYKNVNIDISDNVDNDAYRYADMETAIMIKDKVSDKTLDTHVQYDIAELVAKSCTCTISEYLKDANSPVRDNAKNIIISHRRPSSFWRVLFKQKFDAQIPFRIVWAGETGSDDGWPYREFLLRAMDFIGNLSGLFFGSPKALMFTSQTDAVLERRYYLLGQLCALSILIIGRGPQCLHPSIVEVLLSLPRTIQIDDV